MNKPGIWPLPPIRSSPVQVASVAMAFLFSLSGLLAAGLPPTDIKLNSASVRELQPPGAIVGVLEAVDADPGDTHSFALVSGLGSADNDRFQINGDTLRTAELFEYESQNRFSIRIGAQDNAGNTFEKPIAISVLPPSMVEGWLAYYAANPAVSNAALASLDLETADYFWVYQNDLADDGSIRIGAPANTPPDTATNGTATIYMSSTESTRIHAAKIAHALWLDRTGQVAWRLKDYAEDHLRGLFDKTLLFNRQSSTVFYFLSVVDYSPTQAYRYAVDHGLVRETIDQTIAAVLDDLRSDFLHVSSSYGDPSCAYTLRLALAQYSSTRFRPARISRAGCHSMSRITLALLRSLNIPGYETTAGEYFLSQHSEAVLPCVGRVLPHGDHIYSGSLTTTPSEDLMPTLRFFEDNLFTPPCAGIPHRVALRHEAFQGTQYPAPTILRGVRNPALYGYSTPIEFLSGYAGWNLGLTSTELDQTVDTLLTQYNETRGLTLTTSTPQGWVINNPSAGDYVLNSRVSLKALPKDGYLFSHWTGDVPFGRETANPLVFYINTNQTIQAVFTRPPVTVSIAAGAAGQVQIAFTALADVAYTIEYRDAWNDDPWQVLTRVEPDSIPRLVTQPVPILGNQRFYRVVTDTP